MELSNQYIVLPDLDKKIDEEIHDAINFFNKQCPYCGEQLFSGHIRKKIHFDHFIPISKGGQHVPWNILPVCQKCNSKKKDKNPNIFLNSSIYSKCENYLISIRNKYVGQLQIDIEKHTQIKSLLLNKNFKQKSTRELSDITKSIYQIIFDKQIITEPDAQFFGIDSSVPTLKKIVARHYKIPGKDDIVLKYSITEIADQLQQLINRPIRKVMLSKAMKEMGFLQKVERVDSYIVKRVYYVSMI